MKISLGNLQIRTVSSAADIVDDIGFQVWATDKHASKLYLSFTRIIRCVDLPRLNLAQVDRL